MQIHGGPYFRNRRTALARLDRLWAVTAYFDPFGDRERLPAYREFRRRLRAPLVAVEIAFGDTFDLQEDDADIVVRLQGGAVLWQKERLLKQALRALPDRQLEAVVLRHYMGLSEQQAAAAMGISTGAARAHLASGTASLPRLPRP